MQDVSLVPSRHGSDGINGAYKSKTSLLRHLQALMASLQSVIWDRTLSDGLYIGRISLALTPGQILQWLYNLLCHLIYRFFWATYQASGLAYLAIV